MVFISEQRVAKRKVKNGLEILFNMANVLRIKELQMKTILRFYFSPVRMTKIQKTNDNQ